MAISKQSFVSDVLRHGRPVEPDVTTALRAWCVHTDPSHGRRRTGRAPPANARAPAPTCAPCARPTADPGTPVPVLLLMTGTAARLFECRVRGPPLGSAG
jgi:hypothetical protein